MRDGIEHDVGDVVVGESVGHLASTSLGGQHVGLAQDAQVLGDEWLSHAELVDEIVDTPLALADLEDDGQPQGVGECLQQRGSSIEIRHMHILQYTHESVNRREQ